MISEKVKIVYVHESDEFKLDCFGSKSYAAQNTPVVERLKKNHQELRQKCELPSEVGVVSYGFVFKRIIKDWMAENENPNSSYVPLDVFEKAKKLSEEKRTKFEDIHYVYRTLAMLFSNNLIVLDKRLNPNLLGSLSATPYYQDIPKDTITSLNLIEQQAKEKGLDVGKIIKQQEEIAELGKKLEERISEICQYYGKRFMANKVSKEFWLYYCPQNVFYHDFFSVSLDEKIEIPKELKEILELIKMEMGIQSIEDLPENIRKSILGLAECEFGKTKRRGSLDELLTGLPYPKTLITDCYIIEHFPQIAEMGFDVVEFELSQELEGKK